MKNNRPRKGRREKKRKLKLKPRFYFFILFIFSIIFFIKIKANFSSNQDEKKLSSYYKDSGYLEGLFYANNNFKIVDYSIKDGEKEKLDNYSVIDFGNLSLRTILSMRINDYLKNLNTENKGLQLIIADREGRFIYRYGEIRENVYPGLRSLLAGMGLYKSIYNGLVKENENVRMREVDFDPSSYYFTRNEINTKINLLNLIDLGVKNSDPVALNIIENLVGIKNSTTYEKFLKDNFKIDYHEGKISHEDTVKIAKELYSNREIYLDLTIKDDSLGDLFLNAIYTETESPNKAYRGEEVIYDFGIVEQREPYYYSAYSENLSSKNFSDIGDLTNRTYEEYMIRKELYN